VSLDTFKSLSVESNQIINRVRVIGLPSRRCLCRGCDSKEKNYQQNWTAQDAWVASFHIRTPSDWGKKLACWGGFAANDKGLQLCHWKLTKHFVVSPGESVYNIYCCLVKGFGAIQVLTPLTGSALDVF
jgi:hypothetical protein